MPSAVKMDCLLQYHKSQHTQTHRHIQICIFPLIALVFRWAENTNSSAPRSIWFSVLTQFFFTSSTPIDHCHRRYVHEVKIKFSAVLMQFPVLRFDDGTHVRASLARTICSCAGGLFFFCHYTGTVWLWMCDKYEIFADWMILFYGIVTKESFRRMNCCLYIIRMYTYSHWT